MLYENYLFTFLPLSHSWFPSLISFLSKYFCISFIFSGKLKLCLKITLIFPSGSFKLYRLPMNISLALETYYALVLCWYLREVWLQSSYSSFVGNLTFSVIVLQMFSLILIFRKFSYDTSECFNEMKSCVFYQFQKLLALSFYICFLWTLCFFLKIISSIY